MNNTERNISIEDDGILYFCPITAAGDAAQAHRAIHADICVEADLAGRYAGQIIVEKDGTI